MFKSQIEAAERGIKNCQEMQDYDRQLFTERYLEPGEGESLDREKLATKYASEIQQGIAYWGHREKLYAEARAILRELQAKYRKRFYLFGVIRWPCRNGHDFKLGLRLSARARLAPLEELAGVQEPGYNWGGV